MDLINRAKLESDLNKCEIVNYYDKDDDYVGYFESDTIYSCVRNASKVDAIPLSIIEEIKAEIMEQFEGCDICRWDEDYDYEENDISEYKYIDSICSILKIIDEKVKERTK